MTLNDGMSAILKKICNGLDATLHAFQTVQNASSQAIDTGTIQAAQVEIGQANQLIREMEDSYRRAAEQEERLNNGIRYDNPLRLPGRCNLHPHRRLY